MDYLVLLQQMSDVGMLPVAIAALVQLIKTNINFDKRLSILESKAAN